MGQPTMICGQLKWIDLYSKQYILVQNATLIVLTFSLFSGLVPAKTTAYAGDCCECKPSHNVLQPSITMKE